MAKPGPKPAANNVRALRGDRASRFNYSAPVAPEQPAEQPTWLPDDVRAVWERIAKQTRAMQVGPYAADADADAFTFLAVQGRMIERLAEVLVKQPGRDPRCLRAADHEPVVAKVRAGHTRVAPGHTEFAPDAVEP